MIQILELLLFIGLFYFYGSVPFALIFTYFTRRRDLREFGTGNIGVANAFAAGGMIAGIGAVIGEISKAALPIAASYLFFQDNPWVTVILVLAAIFGTTFSLFLKGKGGLGNTIFMWCILILVPIPAILAGTLSFLVSILIRKSYPATIFTRMVILPTALYFLTFDWPVTGLALASGLVFTLRYKKEKDDFTAQNMGKKIKAFFSRNKYLLPLQKVRNSNLLGGKAGNLRWLSKFGWRIPTTYIVPAQVLANALADEKISVALKEEIIKTLANGKKYAVRSSANVEDFSEHSFAGQFQTDLNVKKENIYSSLLAVRQSARQENVKMYQQQVARETPEIKMNVIIQEMITPIYSGVIFTRSPITGLDEVLIETVPGTAAKLVQGQATPQSWIYKWGQFTEKPAHPEFDNQEKIIARLAQDCKVIERQYRAPVDIEWAYDGRDLYWIQLRPITAIKGINIYSNKISREFLPGLIKPLVWSINIPLVNGGWKNLFMEILGADAKNIEVADLAKSFYHRAYFNMGIVGDLLELFGMRRETLELLLGLEKTGRQKPKFIPGFRIVRYLPSGLRFFISTFSGYRRKIDRLIQFAQNKYTEYRFTAPGRLSETEIVAKIEEALALNEKLVYFNILTPLLMSFRMNSLRNYLADQNVSEDDLADYFRKDPDTDPAWHLAVLHQEYQRWRKTNPQTSPPMLEAFLANSPEQATFRRLFGNFIEKFGHIGQSNNDFSLPTWKENPEIVWDMIRNYRPPRAKKNSAENKIEKISEKYLFRNADLGRIMKQRVSFYYTKCYFLFRPYFLELGRLLGERQALEKPDDIFFLTYPEIKEIVSGRKSDLAKIATRRSNYQTDSEITAQIPETIFGDNPPVLTKPVSQKTYSGLPASKGYYEGRIRKVASWADQKKIQPGEVVVLGHTDVGLNMICTRGKALVTSSGGILSHCAIIAREYRIPAVVSVKEADQLADGQMVAVDGNLGKIEVLTQK